MLDISKRVPPGMGTFTKNSPKVRKMIYKLNRMISERAQNVESLFVRGPRRSEKPERSSLVLLDIPLGYLIIAVAVAASMTVPSPCRGFSKQLWTGVDIGYSGTYTNTDIFPSVFDGLSLGAHALYGFNSYLGISWEAAFDLHPKYQIYEQVEVASSPTKTTLGWAPTDRVDHYYHSTTAFCLVYAIDVFRFVPYLSLGLLGARVDRRIEGDHEASYDVGLRINAGFNYIFKKRFGLGSQFSYDQHLYRNSGTKRRMALLIRLSVVFDFNESSVEKTLDRSADEP